MKVCLEWLKEFVSFSMTAEELGDKLTAIGLQTDAIEKFGGKCEKVIVGEILEIQKHPNADKLTVCQVNVGKERLQIVCGAKNMKAGDRVPVALVGAALPNGMAIGQTKLRGVDSSGMMCSATELKLSEKSDGLMILPTATAIGTDIRKVLPVEDAILELNITPNRGDCLSHLGVAREIAALLKTSLKFPETKFAEEKDQAEKAVQVEIDAEACSRYTARVVKGVSIRPAPLWMQLRLERCGIRPINNVVDITNYVLLELGQPLHAFDFAKIGGGKIKVRWAKAGETLLSLDGKERRLQNDQLVIADEKFPVALAGVMGGKNSEVSEATTELLLESACFAPETVRKTAKGLGLSSESSYRFERGIDFNNVETASRRAARLLQEWAGGKILKGVVDKGKKSWKHKPVSLSIGQVEKILGKAIPEKEIESIFKRLEIDVESKKAGKLTLAIPPHRHDLEREIDLVEEIARFHGYDLIPTTQPRTNVVSHEPMPLQALRSHVVDVLTGLGFNQVVSYSFIGEKDLQPYYADHPEWKTERMELLNPISDDLKIMRPRLLPSLIKAAAYNFAREAKEIRFFEMGRVYQTSNHSTEQPFERDSITLLMASDKLKVSWKDNIINYDFYDIKGISESIIKSFTHEQLSLDSLKSAVYHPGQAAQWKMGGRAVAYCGQLHPTYLRRHDIDVPLFAAEIFLDKLEKIKPRIPKYGPIPRYPKVSRDIALVVDGALPEQKIEEAFSQFHSPVLESIHLFDLYVGPQLPAGKKSLAYSLHYRAKDATLTDEQVNKEHERFCHWLKQKLNCEFRM